MFEKHEPSVPQPRHARTWIALQDRLSSLLGCAPAARPDLLVGMLKRSPMEAVAYWLQLCVAIGIATFGLVLDSTAVVIGAMLIAPLMGPIVNLAMGLAVGSPFLVLRAVGRIMVSVGLAVGGAATITKLLPFNELTSEISARTSPTALDLFTAAFCALAGAYATMRPGSGSTATAAGTSIGISLVPPLCASGYGLGTAQWDVASGALLLFTANLTAIVVVGTSLFAAAGFNRLDVAELETRELEHAEGAPIARALARRLSRVFASPGGPAMRLALPFALLAIVYVPLRDALNEVAWQIRVRSAVNGSLGALATQLVHSRLRVERGQVDVRLLVVGTPDDAEGIQSRLSRDLARASGVSPDVEVVAVPDARTLSGLAAKLRDATLHEEPVVPKQPPSAAELLGQSSARVHELLHELWPTGGIGVPQDVWLTAAGDGIRIAVAHLGNPLDPSTVDVLERSLAQSLGGRVDVTDLALPPELTLTGTSQDLTRVAQAVTLARMMRSVSLCGEKPAVPSEPRGRAAADPLIFETDLTALTNGLPSVTWSAGGTWLLRFVIGPCASASPPAAAPTRSGGADGKAL